MSKDTLTHIISHQSAHALAHLHLRTRAQARKRTRALDRDRAQHDSFSAQPRNHILATSGWIAEDAVAVASIDPYEVLTPSLPLCATLQLLCSSGASLVQVDCFSPLEVHARPVDWLQHVHIQRTWSQASADPYLSAVADDPDEATMLDSIAFVSVLFFKALSSHGQVPSPTRCQPTASYRRHMSSCTMRTSALVLCAPCCRYGLQSGMMIRGGMDLPVHVRM